MPLTPLKALGMGRPWARRVHRGQVQERSAAKWKTSSSTRVWQWVQRKLSGHVSRSIGPPFYESAGSRIHGIFEDAAAWWQPQLNLADEIGDPVRVSAVETSDNLFKVLGVQPALGRSFTAHPDLFGPEQEAIISHRLWQTRFSGDPDRAEALFKSATVTRWAHG